MKQPKGQETKFMRRFKDEARCGKKRLLKNIKISEIKGELDEDKLVPQSSGKKN